MRVKIEYFAVLREQAGMSAEELATQARTPRDLYAELKARHGFTLGDTQVLAAVNEEFRPMDATLKEGDLVVFIPPVAGG